jgi:leucyl/phenylalanyl-tRNA--protein transferase
VTEHLRSFGAIEISRRRYCALLDKAIKGDADFSKLPIDRPIPGARALEIIAQRG